MENKKLVKKSTGDILGTITISIGVAIFPEHATSKKAIIDMATLTGACIIALGDDVIGMMGTDDGLKNDLRRAATETGEKLWELPIWDDYAELIKSDVADMKNTGGRAGGSVSDTTRGSVSACCCTISTSCLVCSIINGTKASTVMAMMAISSAYTNRIERPRDGCISRSATRLPQRRRMRLGFQDARVAAPIPEVLGPCRASLSRIAIARPCLESLPHGIPRRDRSS